MISAAFYAPMKAPDDPVPSGDRTMARAILQAAKAAGVDAAIASRFRSRDGTGSKERQAQLIAEAESEVARLIPQGRAARWQFWLSYHNYYKAPDLIGPKVAAALDIPYLLVEATRARKRLNGPWDAFARAAETATDAAHTVFFVTERDAEALRAYAPRNQHLVHLPPFLARTDLPPAEVQHTDLLAVGMFRKGDKVASYRIIAETLAQISQPGWHIEIAGDGPERATVEAMMQPFDQHVRFLGALDARQMQAAYARARILFWPGVNEAFGMTYLEAQAAGCTVLAQDRPGVRDVLSPGAAYPYPDDGAAALAARLSMLLSMPKLTQHLGAKARAHIARHHLLDTARDTLSETIKEVLA